MDIVFDKWMEKQHPDVRFERYADDIVVHSTHKYAALKLLGSIKARLNSCHLEINEEKSKIVYCHRNQKKQPEFKEKHQKFDFLGFTFKPRIVRIKGKQVLGFTPAISQKSISRIAAELRKRDIHRWVQLPLEKIAELLKSKIRGWINYYGKFRLSDMRKLFRLLHIRLVKWIRNKYRRFKRKEWVYAYRYLQKVSRYYPNLFYHWQYPVLRP